MKKVILGAMLLIAVRCAEAQTATLSANSSSYASAGGNAVLTATIDYTSVSNPTALGFIINIPSGWALVSTGGTNIPSAVPDPGTTGALEYAYTSFPAGQASFTATVSYPAGMTGTMSVTASAVYRTPLTNLPVSSLSFTPTPTLPSFSGGGSSQPTAQTVVYGQPASFSATATGYPLPTYQWRKGGSTIAGATNSVLSFASAAIADAGTYDVVATNGSGSATSNSVALTVNLANQTITFGALAAKNYGDAAFTLGATASSGAAVSYASSNTAVATVSGSTVTIVGVGATTITASQAGNGNYNAASDVLQTLTVSKATATVSLGTLSATYDGAAKAASATTTPSGLTVNVTYNSSGTAPTNAGSYAVVGTIADANYQGTASGTLVVAKAAQTITFGALAGKTYGDATFSLGATASSSLGVSYVSSNTAVATVSGSTVTIVGAGSTTITASQAGDTNYNAASSVPQTLTVAKAAAPVSLGSLSATYDGAAKAASATTTPSGLTVNFTYDSSANVPSNAGSYAVLGTISNANYQGSASGTLVIGKASQTITFGALAAKNYGDATFTLGATASSSVAVSYASSNTAVATVSGSTVTIVGVGATTITASQAGNGNYNAASDVLQTLTVNKGNQTITFGALAPKAVGTGSFVLGATASSSLAVSYTSSNPAVATVSGSTVTILSIGASTITASQAGNSNYNAAPNVDQSVSVITADGGVTLAKLTVNYDGSPKPVTVITNPAGLGFTITYAGESTVPTNVGAYPVTVSLTDSVYKGFASGILQILKAPQTITFGALSGRTLGDGVFSLSAASTSGLPVSFSSSNPEVATVSGATVTLVGAGATTITANQSGDANRLAASPVAQVLTIAKMPATISLSGLTAIANGQPKPVGATTVPAGLPVVLTYNGSTTAPSAGGTYAVVATINHPTYSGAATGSLVITGGAVSRYAGAYFGDFSGNAGSFSIFIRADRSAIFLGYLRTGRVPFVSREFMVDDSGGFQFVLPGSAPALPSANESGSAIPPTAAASSDYAVAGTISRDGFLSGRVEGLNLQISATAAPATGVTQSLTGYYQAGQAGSSAVSYLIVGPSGQAFLLTSQGTVGDAAKASVDASGKIEATTESNARVAGAVDAKVAAIGLSVTTAAGATVSFTGANNDLRTDVEKLINISTRSQTGSATNTLIAGFVIIGTDPKPVLIRAIGPSLSAFGVSGAISAARLEVFREQTSLAVGADWGAGANAAEVAATSARVGAFPLAAGSRDAALLLNLAPGTYTAVVSGQGTAAGVALVEVYDATNGAIPKNQRVINIATRATAGVGDDTLIAGFYVAGSVPKRVLIRGVGPSLAQFGVGGVLARPQLTIAAGGTVVAQNTGVATSADAAAITNASAQVGAFALLPAGLDSAILLNLAPGAYTAQVSGVGNTTGVALIEVYEAP